MSSLMKYRVPHRMFFTWFVPYSARGSAKMVVVLPSLLGILFTLMHVAALTSIWSFPLAVAFGAVWIHGYHRKVGPAESFALVFLGWLLCRIVGLTLFGIGTSFSDLLRSLLMAGLGGLLGLVLQRHERMGRS